MYGGSSLAIYMNGVAQEMLRLVRATAPDPQDDTRPLIPDEKLSGSERVYRKLGKILNRGDAKELDGSTPIRTRFVIDILSGTSAGGINAVFLAKALANNQDIDPLRAMWIKQGDISMLLNDKESDEDIKIGQQDPPRSLLNSRRMYYELLDALEGMDKAAAASAGNGSNGKNSSQPNQSPYVDELDLFTTATDIRGQIIRMRLADNVARERRHLNKFHFSFNSTQNDFARANNPFLAFASRCTSAHPAPFEPMTLADINDVLDKHEDYRNLPGSRSGDKRWRAFFEEYLQHVDDGSEVAGALDRTKLRDLLASKFETRPFSDGGVLDNSPFSFAIDKLQFRQTKLPVDRKLLYIEPVPEHPELEAEAEGKPNALANGWLSLSVLPSYQFIQQDLERVLQRNQLVERVRRILQGVETDEIERLKKKHERDTAKAEDTGVEQQASGGVDPNRPAEDEGPLSSYEFGTRTLGAMIELMGSSWGGYQRLRVAETTDELVKVISSAAGFDEESDEVLAIRYLVRAWREQKYHPYGERNPETGKVPEGGKDGADKFSQNWFLFQYDLKWRLRRLKFVLNKIDEIACMDERTTEIMRITRQARQDYSDFFSKNPEEAKAFRLHLQRLKQSLGAAIKSLDDTRRALLSRVGGESSAETNPLGQAIAAIGIERGDILTILEKPTNDERSYAAQSLLNRKKDSFDKFLECLDAELKSVMDDVSARVKGEKKYQGAGILEEEELSPTSHTPDAIAHSTLRYYYENFDRYDMISYPILYATNVGEELDTVEIFRISPEDAGFLIEDKAHRSRKLAGTSLGNFGAFFDQQFRTNDILWGRLDCTDRLVTALLSSASPTPELKKVKTELLREASRAIIAEELSSEDKAGLRGLLSAAMANTRPEDKNEVFLSELGKRLEGNPTDLSKMQAFLQTCLQGKDPLDDFIATSKFEHELPPKMMVRTSARASRVFGKMLEGIAAEQRFDRKYVVWFTRLAQLFWGLVEVAVPGSIGNLLFRHWLKLIYLFEFLLVLFGTILLNPSMQQLGLLTFAITVAIHATVLFLGDVMADRKGKLRAPPWRRIVKTLVLTALVLLIVLGVAFLFYLFGALGTHNPLVNFIRGRANEFKAWIEFDHPTGANLKTALRFSLPAVIGLFFLRSLRDPDRHKGK
jgi:patatin-related protein